jgi:hypothetical protein
MSVAAVFFLGKEVERKRLELAPQINSLAQQQHEVPRYPALITSLATLQSF